MTTADNAPEEDVSPEEDQLPEGQEAPPSPESSGPETEADQREREFQRRLTQSGREAAEARRQAAAAQAALNQQTAQIAELQGQLRYLSNNLSEREQRESAERQRQLEAELASLPPADRLDRKIDMLQGQINDMRAAAPSARPAPAEPAPAPPSPNGTAPAEPSDAERSAYMERRVREILDEARNEFGVTVNLDEVPDSDWESEDAFYRSVMKQAALEKTARTNGGENMPRQQAAETPAQMRERIRQEERERLGVNSPAAPRATPARGKKAPTSDDVHAQVQSYDSRSGPRANLARLKELRSSMTG
ncbi:MAG: hypothetical protein J2P50_18595 [Hyphomicrobiaceae bacterium]|nr:hypothetical protein [Hyphomicrobiaceae bacterium]